MTVEIPHQRGAPDALSPRELAILDFEREWWSYAGAKEAAVRSRFGVSRTEYDLELDGVLARPAALVHDPQTVLRVRRQRPPTTPTS